MRIPIELEPLPNEILSSWLIRNSISNGSDPGSWVHGIWLNFRTWTRDIDRHLPADKINKLSKITSLSKDQIRGMTLEPIIEKIMCDSSLNPRKAWLFVIPTGNRGTIKINGMHFCKECLKDSTLYLKKEWRLAWNVACPIHKELLLHKCQKCNKTFTPYKVDYLNTQIYKCTYCGFDLRLSESTVANEEVLVFQRKLNNAVFYDIIENNFPIIENTQEELFNTIRIFISFFKALLWLHKRHILFEKIDLHEEINLSNYPKGTTFEAMSSADREQLLLVVLKLFTLNINEIQQLFIDLHIVKKSLLSQVLTTSKTINHLAKNLADSGTKRIYAGRSAEIVPKTKDEIEALMDEIRPFI